MVFKRDAHFQEPSNSRYLRAVDVDQSYQANPGTGRGLKPKIVILPLALPGALLSWRLAQAQTKKPQVMSFATSHLLTCAWGCVIVATEVK